MKTSSTYQWTDEGPEDGTGDQTIGGPQLVAAAVLQAFPIG